MYQSLTHCIAENALNASSKLSSCLSVFFCCCFCLVFGHSQHRCIGSAWVPVITSLGCTSWCGIVGSHRNPIFFLFVKQSVFYSNCAISQPYLQTLLTSIPGAELSLTPPIPSPGKATFLDVEEEFCRKVYESLFFWIVGKDYLMPRVWTFFHNWQLVAIQEFKQLYRKNLLSSFLYFIVL